MKQSRLESHDLNQEQTGSPMPGEPVFLIVGKFHRTHGLQGEIILEPMTDFPERFKPGKTVYVGQQHEAAVITAIRNHDKYLLITLDGYDSCDTVSRFRNHMVYVKSDEVPKLPKGKYYHHELLGVKILSENGEELGILQEIMETGANDVYLVKTNDDKELLLPAIEGVILEIDLNKRVMRVCPPQWE
jgi:16S rRNA processing protein RimM